LFFKGIAAMFALFTMASDGMTQGTIQDAQAWYEALLVFVMRPGLAAIFTGFLLALVIPQRVKMDFPLTWGEDRRRFVTRLVSFASGFLGTGAIWPLFWDWSSVQTPLDGYGIMISGFFAAILVGALAPWSYALVMSRIYKLGWLDEGRWSGEARARLRQAESEAGITDGPKGSIP
jgi:hypothetical protein